MCVRNALLGFAIVLAAPLPAFAAPDPDGPAGQVVAEIGGREVSFPLVNLALDVQIRGDLATVTLVQTFENPAAVPVDARYLFPLAHEGAVHRMTMAVGDEIVEAVMKERAEAERTYETARSEGRAASLLNQHRPNMFTMSVANLMPGKPVRVTLTYVQPVPRTDGVYELAIPLVVGPRYMPVAQNHPLDGDNPATITADGWRIEAPRTYPPVIGLDLPKTLDPGRVTLSVTVDGGMPLADLASPSHPLAVTREGEARMTAKLAEGPVIPNRDLILRYRLSGEAVQAGVQAHRDDRGGFVSILIEPPAVAPEAMIQPRELVFVLDTSGSMAGPPLETVKTFMRKALEALRPTDSFRIIRFANDASSFSTFPVRPNAETLARAHRYIDALEADGGTEMAEGVTAALAGGPPQGALRVVVFLTDGYIGNEHEVLALVGQKLGKARLFALGVGDAVNRFLLDRMGMIGRGFARIVSPEEDAAAAAEDLARQIEAPLLTNIAIDWGGLTATEQSPDPIPDLFAGRPVRVLARAAQPGTHIITVKGMLGGRPASLPLTVTVPETSTPETAAIALIWAREAIRRRMDEMTLSYGEDTQRLQAEVTKLGLDFGLMTNWTSFVAVSRSVVNPTPVAGPHQPVPLAMVNGVGPGAYGQPAATGGAPGAAAPEPEQWAALIAVLLMLALWYRRGLISAS